MKFTGIEQGLSRFDDYSQHVSRGAYEDYRLISPLFEIVLSERLDMNENARWILFVP